MNSLLKTLEETMLSDPTFALLKTEARDEAQLWLSLCVRIHEAEQKMIEMDGIAAQFRGRNGFSRANIQTRYYRWLKFHKDWQVHINQAKLEQPQLRAAVHQIYRRYCENNQRVSSEAWNSMMQDFRRGERFANVGTWMDLWKQEHPDGILPERCPADYVPAGWTYSQLQRKAGLTKYEKKAARIGTRAAREFVLPVLTTRLGMLPGQYFQFDDKWHDIMVNFPGQTGGVRPLEIACYDVASAHKVAFGLRPRLTLENGKRENLKELEMRYLLAYLLTEIGYHKAGCALMVEHGTAAVREPLEKLLGKLTGGLVRVEKSGVLTEQVHAGMFAGRGGGNFKFKAMIESSHGREHNAVAALAGQVGRNPDNEPEQMHGLCKYNAEILKIALKLPPEKAVLLIRPLLDYATYATLYGEICERLADHTDHDLEGWSANSVAEFRLSEDSRPKPMAMLDAMSAEQRRAIEAFLQMDPSMMGVRKLSRKEVWARGQADLVRMPRHTVPMILGEEAHRTVRVQDNGLIELQDRYLGEGLHIYHSTVRTPDGFTKRLERGRKYIGIITPYAPERIWLIDMASGILLGEAPRYDVAPRADRHAIEVLMGQQNHDIKELSDPIRGRHQVEAEAKAEMMAHNAAVIASEEPARATAAAISEGRKAAIKGISVDDFFGGPVGAGPEQEENIDEAVDQLDVMFARDTTGDR